MKKVPKVGDKLSYTSADNNCYKAWYTVTKVLNKKEVEGYFEGDPKSMRKTEVIPIANCKFRVKKVKLSRNKLAEAWNRSLTSQNLFIDVAEASTYFDSFCKRLGL